MTDLIEKLVQPESPWNMAASMLEPKEFKPKLEQYWYNPEKFIKDYFYGFKSTKYQRECINALLPHKKVCVRGPHGLGKTGMVSAVVLWFAHTREDMCRVQGGDWKIVTTASVERQLTKFLWPEIRKWTRKSNFAWEQLGREPFDRRTELLFTQLKLEYGEAFAVSSDDPTNIEGAHADHILYIVDEAKTVRPETFEAMEGALSGAGEAFAFVISTPGPPNGKFFEIQTNYEKRYSDWWVRAVTLAESIAAGRITQRWADARRTEWGEGSSLYKNRVLGQFAVDALDGVIPMAWVEAAMQRGETLAEYRAKYQEVRARSDTNYDNKYSDGPRYDKNGTFYDPDAGIANCISCDVARSTALDNNVIALRAGYRALPLMVFKSEDTMLVADRVFDAVHKYGVAVGSYAVVDVVGIGAGVVDRLRQKGIDVEAFHGGSASSFTDSSGELTFSNRRAASWWGMRELLNPMNPISAEVILPDDEKLLADLCTPKYIERAGKVAVESKDEIRKRLGRSPDRGDAIVMAYADRELDRSIPEGTYIVYDDPSSISPF